MEAVTIHAQRRIHKMTFRLLAIRVIRVTRVIRVIRVIKVIRVIRGN